MQTTEAYCTHIGGMRVNASNYTRIASRIIKRSADPTTHYICISNVHMTMEAWDDPDYRDIVNSSFLVTSDGMPLVWVLRMRGHKDAERVYGPTLMLHVCEAAAKEGLPIGLYGGAPKVLDELKGVLLAKFPGLQIPVAISPPFGPVSPEQDAAYCKAINESGARILFVGLGCPKQERWMHAHKDSINAVMLGVGAAFNFHAGHVKQAPAWLQKIGMEWAFRFAMEPRRLWKRYLWHNPRFILLVLREQLFGPVSKA